MRRMLRICRLPFAVLLLSLAAIAQTAQIRVDVSDSTGAVITGATITVSNSDTGVSHTYMTDTAGLAAAPALQPGPYLVTVDKTGFAKYQQRLTLTVGQVAEVRATLGMAAATETVEVSASSPVELDTTNANVSGLIEEKQLEQLPVINRGFIGLAQLLPGGAASLVGDARFGEQTTFGGANVRSGYSTIVDGASMDHPIYGLAIVDINQDDVQEFRVLHNQFDAEYSRAGTAVVDVITKSGTNRYKGMFSYFGQDQSLDATNYFATTKPPFNETHTSGTFGGPIIKDKAHFFVADEYLKQNSSYIEALPASNPFASIYNGTFPGFTDEKTVQSKEDYQPTSKDSLYVRWLFEKQQIRQSYQLQDNYNIAFNDGILNWTHTFSNAVLNDAQLEYLDQNTLRYQTATGPEIIRPSFTSGTPPNLPQAYPRRRIGLNDSFYVTKGRNTMKMGTRLAYEDLHQRGNFYGAGVWTFNTNTPFTPGVPSTYPTAYTVGSGLSDEHYGNAELGFFFQDDIKLGSRLTLNAGLRYDIETNLRDNAWLKHTLANPGYAGLNNFINGNRGNYTTGVQPRFGFAYDLTGSGRTVIRGGIGGYSARNRPFFDTQMQSQDDNFTVQITNPALLANYPSQTAVLGGVSLAQYVAQKGGRSMYLVGDNLRIPYIYDYTAGVERQLTKNTALIVDGVRQVQTGLQTAHDANLPSIGPLSSHPRPFPQFGTVTIFNSTNTGYYSALQVQLKSQYRRAATQVSYTWAKSLSTGLDDNTSAISDPFHVYGNIDRGLDEEDRRHALVISPLINLPFNVQLSGIISLISGPPFNIAYGKDFDGDGVTQDRPPGLPKGAGGQASQKYLAIINAARTSTAPTVLSNGFVIPALNSPTCATSTTTPCLKPITMSQLAPDTFTRKIDVRLTKALNFKERYRLELFMEGYNIFNTPTFQPPTGAAANISSPAFLGLTTTSAPRQLQWGVRFVFGVH